MDVSDQYTKMCKSLCYQPQREIKFRYVIKYRRFKDEYHYDVEYKIIIITLDEIEYRSIKDIIVLNDRCYFEMIVSKDEYTGLQDNNKTEVYENDNIQFKYLNNIRVAKVVIAPGYGAHLDDERQTRLQYALNHGGVVVMEERGDINVL